MILAKLGMGLLGAAMKKGAGAAVSSGLAGSMSSGLASTLGKSALSALGGKGGGGKGGGMGGGRGGKDSGMGGGKGGGMGGGRGGQKGSQGGKGRQSGQNGQGSRSPNSQAQDDTFSLEDILNKILEQNTPKSAPQKQAPVQIEGQAEVLVENTSEAQAQMEGLVQSEGQLSSAEQVQAFQEALAVLEAHIVSSSTGRVRIRHPQLKQSQDYAALEQILVKEGMSSVVFKESTASVLISYDAKRFSYEVFLVAVLPLAIYIVCGKIA